MIILVFVVAFTFLSGLTAGAGMIIYMDERQIGLPHRVSKLMGVLAITATINTVVFIFQLKL